LPASSPKSPLALRRTDNGHERRGQRDIAYEIRRPDLTANADSAGRARTAGDREHPDLLPLCDRTTPSAREVNSFHYAMYNSDLATWIKLPPLIGPNGQMTLAGSTPTFYSRAYLF